MNNNQIVPQQIDWNVIFNGMILMILMVGMTKIISREFEPQSNRIWLVYVTPEGKWGAWDISPAKPTLTIHKEDPKKYLKEWGEHYYLDAEAQVQRGRFTKYYIAEAPTRYKAIKGIQLVVLPEHHSSGNIATSKLFGSRDEPQTPRQARYITILCMKLGIKEPLEEEVRTEGEAGILIRELEAKVRALPEHHSSITPPKSIQYGTCYEDAWRFLIKEEESELVHGSVQLTEGGVRVKHAWVELPTGYIWEPQTKQYFTIKDFGMLSPIEEHRYSVEEAAIMLARVGKHGPWTDEERARWLNR